VPGDVGILGLFCPRCGNGSNPKIAAALFCYRLSDAAFRFARRSVLVFASAAPRRPFLVSCSPDCVSFCSGSGAGHGKR